MCSLIQRRRPIWGARSRTPSIQPLTRTNGSQIKKICSLTAGRLGRIANSARRGLRRSSRPLHASAGSSISDRTDYVRLCEAAAAGGPAFDDFRSNRAYREILEHVTPDQGLQYLKAIERDLEVSGDLAALTADDTVGRPQPMRVGPLPDASPTTLRYIKVLTDLRHLFGPLDGLNVAEIGIGYGGQARILTAFHNIPRYELFDLPPVLELAERFLSHFPATSTQFALHDGRNVPPANCDLVVSNFAFSELRREVQEDYLDRVVASAPRGYMTYNHISPPEFRSLTAQEFAARIPGSELIDEVPLTHRRNVIVIWGHRPGPLSA